MDILDGAYDNILIIFACQDKCMTILDSVHIKEMQKFTGKAIDDEIWPRICYRNNNQRKVDSYQCSESAYQNLTRYIEPYIDTFTDLQIQNYISNFIKSQDIFNQAKVSLDKDFTLNHPYSKYLGVKLKFAGPVQDTQWVEKIDNKNKSYFQEEAVKDLESLETRALIKNFLSNVYEKACNFKSDKVKVWALNHDLFVAKETEAVEQDKIYTFYIALFVWLYLSLHQRSLFLGTFSIFQIIASIPISLVIFKYILRIEYFCQLHLFVIIVIMGIGADDIFVFHDQWQHTKCIRILRKRLILRLAYTMRKATNAMLVTSITTAVSFLATCISPIMPIVSFGLFAALVISVNFLLIILVLPNIYLLYENHLRKRFQCFNFIYKKLRKCFRNLKNLKKQKQRTDIQNQVIQNGPLDISQDLKDDNINSFQKQLQNFQMAINDSSLDIMLLEKDDQNSSTENENHDQQIDKTEDFENYQMKEGGEILIVKEEWDSQYQEFEEENTQIIQNKVTVQFNQNFKTKVLSSHHRKKNNNNQNFNSLEMLKESQSKHINYNDYVFKKKGIIMNLFEKYFGKCVFVLRVPIILLSFIWLIFSIYFAFNIPRLMLKQTFLSKSHPVQQALDIVDTHFGLNEEKTLFLNIIFGLKDQLYDLNKTNTNTFWNRNQIGVPVFDAFFDLSPEKNQELMLELCDQIQTSEYIKQIKNEKQINCPLQDFKNYLLLKKQVFPVPQQDFNRSIIEYHKFSNDQNLYIIDNKLRCVKINFHVIDVESYKFQIKMDVYQYYQHIITDIQRKWPQGINQVMQVPYDQWAFLNLEDSMFTNAMSGMICSIIFSFLVLLITTHNYVVSFYSIIAILMVISTIFSTIYFQGLGIGIAESIALIVFIGFSVDYIVHMCHQYNESVYDQKKNRVETCFQKIGVTITDAAVTSFVAGIFLYKCQFNYLHQFGIFMMVTISSSLFFSLIFFPALCYQVGPEFKQGDIKHNFIMPVKKWLAKRRLQRIKKTYKRFQKRFYKKQFDHVNSDSDEEDQNTINLRKISFEEQKTQEMLSIHENSQLNSQQQRLFRLSQKNKQRLIYLSLKGKIKYRKMKKLFREDIRYFRKHLGMYYEGVKDKYDEDYMFMDSFGKELEGSKLEQFFLAKSLEDNLNIDGTMKDVIIIANAQETYMQLEKMDLESGNQIQMSDNSFVDEQDQIQENQILPEEPDKIQIKNNQSNQFFVENQIHLNVQENPLQQNFNEFLQKKMELRHFRSIMKFKKNMQNVFMIENEDFKKFQEQQKQNLNLQLMEKYKNEEEKDISNFGKSKRSKTDHYSQTYIQNIKNNLIIGEQAQQQVQNNQILQKPKTSKKYFNVQKIQKDIQAQLKKLQNTITKNRSFLKRSSSQSKEKKQKYTETEDKKENSHQKSQKSQNSFFSDSESNDNSEDEYEEYIYQKYFQQKSQQENIHDKTKLTVEEDTKNIEFEENDSQTQFQTKYLFKSQILAEDNI